MKKIIIEDKFVHLGLIVNIITTDEERCSQAMVTLSQITMGGLNFAVKSQCTFIFNKIGSLDGDNTSSLDRAVLIADNVNGYENRLCKNHRP